MCFSATGSFGVAAALAGVGVFSVTRKKASAHRLLASTPFLFSAQQVAEGMVWLTIHDQRPESPERWSVALFLGFALMVWPTWMPLSLFVAERNPRRRKTLARLLAIGVGVSIYAGALLFDQHPTARIAGHSIEYDYSAMGSRFVLALYLPAYIVPTIVPFFVSTMDKAKIMGGILLFGLFATFLIQRQALTSVWCFFAAIMSGVIVLSIAAERRIEVLATAHRLKVTTA